MWCQERGAHPSTLNLLHPDVWEEAWRKARAVAGREASQAGAYHKGRKKETKGV